MSFFSSRKPIYLNIAFLLLFLGGWLFSYMFPVLKGLFQDDHLFYGTVTHASIPSIFGGSDIPFFDKIMFQINGDDQTTFVLYASKDLLNDMSDWYSFGAVNAGDVPLEISAARVGENKFVVHGIASAEGELDFQALVMDYQVNFAFLGVILVGLMVLVALIFLLVWLVKKRRR